MAQIGALGMEKGMNSVRETLKENELLAFSETVSPKANFVLYDGNLEIER